jgi:nucleoid-associated protein YgaU
MGMSTQPQLTKSTTQTPAHLPTFTRAPDVTKTPAQFAGTSSNSTAGKILEIKEELVIDSRYRTEQPSRDLSDNYLARAKAAKPSELTSEFSAKSNALAAKVNELKRAVEKILPVQPVRQTNHQSEFKPDKTDDAIQQANFQSDQSNEFSPGLRAVNSTDANKSSVNEHKNAMPKNVSSESNDFSPVLAASNKQALSESIPPATTHVDSETSEEEMHLTVIDHVNGVPAPTSTGLRKEPEVDVENRSDEHWYKIQRGDSFWTIAQVHYDDGRYFKALYKLNENRVDGFEKIGVGNKIQIPSLDDLQARFPALCPNTVLTQSHGTNKKTTYETIDGDTLFDVARRLTGQASNYLELIRLNREQLPDDVTHLTRLPSGVSLRLPQR